MGIKQKSDELKLRSADNLQIYGAYLGGNDCGAQDYTKAIQLRGVRIVDAKWLESLAASHDELLEALEMCTKAMASVLPDFNPYDQAAYDKARAAIAKAKGEGQ